jgi:uncharacterized protein
MAARALLLALALALSACAPMAGPDGGPRRLSTVTVSGVGTVIAPPDMAEITAGVVTRAPTAAQALAQNNQAMAALLQTLAGVGIAARDIQTTNVSVSPQRRPGRDATPTDIVAYEVVSQVHVKVRDLPSLGRVLDQQVAQGANSLSGIRFGLNDPAPLLDEARWPTPAARRSSTRPPPPSRSGGWCRCRRRARRRRVPSWPPAR